MTADEQNIHVNGFYVGLILNFGRYCNMESRQTVRARRCNKPQSQRSISHQLVVRKALLLTSHPEYQTVQSGRSLNRISFPGGVQKVCDSCESAALHLQIRPGAIVKSNSSERKDAASPPITAPKLFFSPPLSLSLSLSLSSAWFLMNMQTNICFILRTTKTRNTQIKRK